jgi:2-iminobutanoate/2-iminopropanoate deaminase
MIDPVVVGDLMLPFSHAVRAGEFLFVSGQASVDLASGEIVKGTLAEEMERSFRNLRYIIESAGGLWENIVKVNCYVRLDSDLPEYNRIYREFFNQPYPARTTITKCLPESLLFEVDCVVSL